MPQMDLQHIRCWDSKTGRVKLHYLDSFLSGKSSAKDVFEYFDSSIQTIDKAKHFQVFSDGPDINLAFLELLNESRHEAELKELLDIGTHGLHIAHNAFQHGKKASNWNVKKHLSTMSRIFHESPLMQTDFEMFTSST